MTATPCPYFKLVRMVRSMGKLTDKKLNEVNKYINFYDFICFMEVYTGDSKQEIAHYLLSHKEIIYLMTYCVNFGKDTYPFYKILANDNVGNDSLSSNYGYHFLKDLSNNGMFDDRGDYIEYYWKKEDIFNLDFLSEIGLNLRKYYQFLRDLEHGQESELISKNGIGIDKPSDLQQRLAHFEAQETINLKTQLASATDTTERQAKEIAELKAQLASIEQAGKDTQSDTASNDKALSNVEQAGKDTQSDTPANGEPLKGIAKVNYDKDRAKAFARIVAKFLWDMDTTQQIKSGDMANQIYALLVNFNNEATPETTDTIKEWLTEITPTYAKLAGRPSKNQPKEIPLTLRK